VGAVLLESLPDCDILHADKAYDANAIRRQIEERGVMPNISPKANRKWKLLLTVSLSQQTSPWRHHSSMPEATVTLTAVAGTR
jgi:hypothetical protein